MLKTRLEQNDGNKRRGLMVQAPMGTGKSYYIKNRVPAQYADQIVDGDALLDRLQIKNRNYFWYDPTKDAERQKILTAFQNTLNDGVIILYSGHPELIPTDVLVIPDSKVRWGRLQNRDDFKPSRKQFEREELAYEAAREKVAHVFDDIPDFDTLLSIRNAK
jgi:hypothetical protein